MKVQSISVNLGRKILHETNEHSIEIALQVDLEPDEDTESVYYSVKNSLEGQLDTWEHEIRANDKPNIISIPEMTTIQSSATAPPLIHASEMNPKASKISKKQKQNSYQSRKEPEEEEEVEQEKQRSYICPICGDQMLPKDGKEYYLCSKHWGYPDMIKKGNVRDRKF